MKQVKIGCLLSLIFGLLVGCSFVQTDSQMEKSSQNTASIEAAQKDDTTHDEILFKGNNMTVIEKEKNGFKKLRFDSGKKSCLNKADEKIEKKLSALGFKRSTEYLEFEAVETSSFGADKFIVNFDKNLFSRINPDLLKKLDEYVGFTDSRNLYFVKNNDVDYLLLIGHQSATSGMGHYYRIHLLLPLDSNKPVIDFQSMSDDPRRVKIVNSGTIYYTQIDLDNDNIKDYESKRMPLIVSLFTIDNTGNKNLETKFGLDCQNINSIMLDTAD